MIRRIITTTVPAEETVLRTVASAVPEGEVGTTRIQSIVADLKETLAATSNGIAIAAPQVGESVRIFVVSPSAFGKDATEGMVCINPVISRRSKEHRMLEEGCLSIPGIYGTVSRAHKVTLDALDEHGNPFRRGASGLLAQIFQHENDHLDGILFTDTAIEVREATPADDANSEPTV